RDHPRRAADRLGPAGDRPRARATGRDRGRGRAGQPGRAAAARRRPPADGNGDPSVTPPEWRPEGSQEGGGAPRICEAESGGGVSAPSRNPYRSLLIPEVVQTSAMDCGPASLASLLAGFGLPVNYGRLREACQTDVDGTSIDTIEDVARALGLDAEQVVVPVDHTLRPDAGLLPALTVVRLPNGLTHFVVIWRAQLGWVQLMDPAAGRVWMRASKLLERLYIHAMPVAAADWREWAGGDDFLQVLRARMRELGAEDRELLARAIADPGA